jgi:hypothetical protein
MTYQPIWSGQDTSLRDELDRISREFRYLEALIRELQELKKLLETPP